MALSFKAYIRLQYEMVETDGREVQTVHEHDLLMTHWGELFLVLAIFGTEFTINFGGPEISGYLRWLD